MNGPIIMNMLKVTLDDEAWLETYECVSHKNIYGPLLPFLVCAITLVFLICCKDGVSVKIFPSIDWMPLHSEK